MMRGALNVNSKIPQEYGAYSYKLYEIVLYSNATAPNNDPIKTVHFEYADPNDPLSPPELCPSVLNNESGGGKLTLTKVHFTYENNSRGSLSPYKFEYNGINKSYNTYQFDRWGVFAPHNGTLCKNIHNPYVDQSSPNVESDLAANIMSWHLTGISLPSGSKIDIDAGRDHYAYVQDRIATQMFNVYSFGPPPGTGQVKDEISNSKNPSSENRRIYFELEEPIQRDPSNPGLGTDKAVLEQQYLKDLYQVDRDGVFKRQLYFKVNTDLANNGVFEDVSGYADIESFGMDDDCTDCKDGSGNFTIGYIELSEFPIEIKGDKYHPIVVSNWQFLKKYAPSLLFDNTPPTNQPSSDDGIKNIVKGIGLKFGEFIAIFRSFYGNCREKRLW